MARRLGLLLSTICLALAFSACSASPPSRFYTLDSTATADGSPPVSFGVMVRPAAIPAAVDRPQFVVQVAPNRVEIEEFNRWAAPLGDSIARTVAGDLAILLGTPDVATTPLANFKPAFSVTIDVQRFESVLGQEVVLDAVWAVRKDAGDQVRAGRTIAREAAPGDTYDALAAAHSRALARLSADIAAAIRAM